ncbi:hypothetical protein BST61_g7192 [Cercospora zeina]
MPRETSATGLRHTPMRHYGERRPFPKSSFWKLAAVDDSTAQDTVANAGGLMTVWLNLLVLMGSQAL